MAWADEPDILKHFKMITSFDSFMRRVALAAGTALLISLLGLPSYTLAYYLQSIFLILLLYCVSNLLFPVVDSNDGLINLVTSPKSPSADTLENQSTEGAEDNAKSADKAHGATQKRDRGTGPGMDEPVFLPASLGDGSIFSIIVTSPALSLIAKVLVSSLLAYVINRLIFFHSLLFQRSAILFIIVFCAIYLLTDELLAKISKMEISDFPKAMTDKALYRFWRIFSSSEGYHFLGTLGRHRIGLPRWMRFLHLLIAGPTGIQKSTSQIIPQLLHDATAPGSAVAPDPKSPELFTKVAGRWIKHGKKAFLFDPWHDDSVAFNPLLNADDKDLLTITSVLLQEREEVINEEAFFKSRTRYLLYAILRLVQTWGEQHCNLVTVYHLVQSVDTLDQFLTILPSELALLFSDYHTKLSKESKVNALTSIREKLDIFMDPAVRRAFSRSDFTLDMLFREKEPCLLMLGAPIDHKDAAMKINSLVVNLIVNMAFRETRMRKQRTQAGEKTGQPNDLYLYLDELRSLKVTALPDLVSIARDTRTQIICSVTDLNFFNYYGHDRSSLFSNLRTQVYFTKLDLMSAKYISESLGTDQKTSSSWMRGPVVRQDEAQVLQPSAVQNLAQDELIIFNPVIGPFVAQLASINTAKWLEKMVEPCPRSMRPYYAKWGLPVEALPDPKLPRVDDITYDMAALKRGRPVEEVKYISGVENHEERGGGKIRIGEKQPVQDEPPSKGYTSKHDDLDFGGGFFS